MFTYNYKYALLALTKQSWVGPLINEVIKGQVIKQWTSQNMWTRGLCVRWQQMTSFCKYFAWFATPPVTQCFIKVEIRKLLAFNHDGHQSIQRVFFDSVSEARFDIVLCWEPSLANSCVYWQRDGYACQFNEIRYYFPVFIVDFFPRENKVVAKVRLFQHEFFADRPFASRVFGIDNGFDYFLLIIAFTFPVLLN